MVVGSLPGVWYLDHSQTMLLRSRSTVLSVQDIKDTKNKQINKINNDNNNNNSNNNNNNTPGDPGVVSQVDRNSTMKVLLSEDEKMLDFFF